MTDQFINTIDGKAIITTLTPSECCPPSLCNIDLNSFTCSFLAYLPKGPLWDYWKRIKQQQLLTGSSGCLPYQSTENSCCATLIDHAIYTATKLYNILTGPLQASITESNPLTAFTTKSNWLSKFGWNDCFSGPSASSDLGFPTPYQAVCNALLPTSLCPDPTEFSQMSGNATVNPNPVINIEELVKAACPADLLQAVEHGILVALQRLQLGIIKNQDGINFILDPLGASISIVNTEVTTPCQIVNEFDCNQMIGTEDCTPYRPLMNITLTHSRTTLASGPGITEALTCDNIQQPQTTVNASYAFAGITMPVTTDCPEYTIAGAGTIWPGILAAECILRSILPYNLNYAIIRV